MSKARRALPFALAERYCTIVLNFIQIAVVSRLLSPEQVGVAAIGATIIALAESVRDSPSAYLVQKHELSATDARAAFTVMLAITLVIALLMTVGAVPLGQLFNQSGLSDFFLVIAIALLPGCIERPIMALLRRDMAFRTYAAISILSALVALIVTTYLAYAGFGFMCFAWGALAGSTSAALIAVMCRPDVGILLPSLAGASEVLRFNAYGTLVAVVGGAYDMLPYVVLGRMTQHDGAGFYNRTITVARLPDKLNAGLLSFLLPALSAIVRGGGNLGEAYIKAIRYITVIEWPLRALVAITAEPVVWIILGPQWHDVVPLVQVMSMTLLFATPQILTAPTLVATGHLRDTVLITLIWCPLAAIIIVPVTAYGGLSALVWASVVIIPMQTFVSMSFVRRRAPFSWGDLGSAIWPSLVITMSSAAGPLAILAAVDFRFDLFVAVLSALAFVVGWLGSVFLVKHPILFELQQFFGAVVSYFVTKHPTKETLNTVA